MKIELTEVYGFAAAIRAMRNPMNSWHLSDSRTHCDPAGMTAEGILIGPADAELSRKLTRRGAEHAKHLRMIMCWVDLTLPRYIWAEMDTYQHTVKVSCSTVHKLKSKPLEAEDFEGIVIDTYIRHLNDCIERGYSLESIKNDLPEGYLQKRTFMTSYAQLLNIRNQRRTHPLKPWHTIADWIDDLPHFKELTGIDEGIGPDPFSFMLELSGPNRCTLIVTSARQLKPSDFEPLRPYFPDGAELFVRNTLFNGAEILFTVRKEAQS